MAGEIGFGLCCCNSCLVDAVPQFSVLGCTLEHTLLVGTITIDTPNRTACDGADFADSDVYVLDYIETTDDDYVFKRKIEGSRTVHVEAYFSIAMTGGFHDEVRIKIYDDNFGIDWQTTDDGWTPTPIDGKALCCAHWTFGADGLPDGKFFAVRRWIPGTEPESITITLAGFTGDCAVANGSFTEDFLSSELIYDEYAYRIFFTYAFGDAAGVFTLRGISSTTQPCFDDQVFLPRILCSTSTRNIDSSADWTNSDFESATDTFSGCMGAMPVCGDCSGVTISMVENY